ncbi:MAG: SDR family NAD(P)-dependent oxidoreductase [Deltaproteobacteria bacterium]|jgi:NAD(P)-dependent dehydrogenase (short-subunit alcohol dehydrogenase family)|nr:SDR family NAD(P)-dependent oxidoreductase [Deltaproteobacteria bacterium]
MELTGTNIVVTGGGNGIGRALCERFAAEGARRVTVVDLDETAAARVAEGFGGVARGVDVARREALVGLVREVESEAGPIDLFASNAGIAIVGGEELPVDDWQRIWEVNVMAHVHAAHAVLPSMLERGEGYLLNTASAAGLLSQIGSAPYAVTKHGAVAFAEWLSITYGDRGIRVSVLCPQAVRTAMTAGQEDGGVAGVDGMIEPVDVAEAVVQGLAEERFLILPHENVRTYYARKGQDIDRWLAGMRRLASRYGDRAI